MLTYFTIVVRDLGVLAITVVFLLRVGMRERSLKRQLSQKEDLLDVMDLSTVLYSVTPLMAFSKFLNEHMPNYSQLLRLIQMIKILEEQINSS